MAQALEITSNRFAQRPLTKFDLWTHHAFLTRHTIGLNARRNCGLLGLPQTIRQTVRALRAERLCALAVAANVAESPRPLSQQQLSHGDVTHVPALKEWAITCAALSAGLQTVVLRKGGISEKGFDIPAARFLLFPTSFHSGASLVQPHAATKFAKELASEPKDQPQLRVDTIAQVSGAWTTSDPEVVRALSDFHVWTPDYLTKRLKWRQQQPITVLWLQCRRLQHPLEFDNSPELWGCFSWVSVQSHADADALWQSGAPVLSEDTDTSQHSSLCRALDQLHGVCKVDIA